MNECDVTTLADVAFVFALLGGFALFVLAIFFGAWLLERKDHV